MITKPADCIELVLEDIDVACTHVYVHTGYTLACVSLAYTLSLEKARQSVAKRWVPKCK